MEYKDGQLFRVKVIKSKDDLPKKEGLYPCYAEEKGLCWFGIPQNKPAEWMFKVRWYIEPIEEQEPAKPTIVCICGSGRFLKEMHEIEEKLTLEGKIVLMIGVNTKDVARTEDLEKYKPMLDELHLRKIDLADEVLIVAVNDYIGESTRHEIEYATFKNKKIIYYKPHYSPIKEPAKGAEAILDKYFHSTLSGEEYCAILEAMEQYRKEGLREVDSLIEKGLIALKILAKTTSCLNLTRENDIANEIITEFEKYLNLKQ